MTLKHYLIPMTFLASTFGATASPPQCNFGPDTCKPGFVWREAFPGDHVCVTGSTREQARSDNLAADARTGWGIPCRLGYVMRQASPDDRVCVTERTRGQVAIDNAQAIDRRDLQCAAPAVPNDASPPNFMQNSISFQRVSDGIEVGSQVVPVAGLTISGVAGDQRFVIAATAADNESGVAGIRLKGGINWTCNPPSGGLGEQKFQQMLSFSDEMKNKTSVLGNPVSRSAHFTIDPFAEYPKRFICGCDNTGPLTVGITLVTQNGRGLETNSPPIAVAYAPQKPSCAAGLGAWCGPRSGQVLPCATGQECAPILLPRSCSGWWIFRDCGQRTTEEMYCVASKPQ